MMRILFLTMYFYPDVGANSVIVTELAEALTDLGHQVTVVTAFPHYATNVVEEAYRNKLVVREEYRNIQVIRTYLFTAPQKERFFVRLLNYLSFNLLSTLAGIFSGKQDLILAPSPPLTIGLSAMIIGFLKGIPYIYNVQDINPDVLIKLGILKNRLVIAFAKGLEKFVYRHASGITVLSPGFKQNLTRKGVPEEKISIIPNFVDPDFVRPGPKANPFSEAYQLSDKFVVLYAGNLGHSQNIEMVLESAAALQHQEQIEFVIVGNGSREDQLKRYAAALGLRNVQFIPFQPLEAVPDIYASAGVSLVTLKKGIALDSVPSKILTIMASGRPVLAAVDPGSDAWDLVERADCGICVPPDDPQTLAEAILALRDKPELSLAYGRRGREYITQYHTRRVIGDQYHQVIHEITRKRRR